MSPCRQAKHVRGIHWAGFDVADAARRWLIYHIVGPLLTSSDGRLDGIPDALVIAMNSLEAIIENRDWH
jgi:hypothetical protein